MATKGKESPSPKEKRVTSPSQPRKMNTSQLKKIRNTSKQAFPINGHDSTTLDRHTPNYLKPTISSGHDLSTHQLKKNVSSDSKSNITRRKSFDKPLLTYQVQKTLISPSAKEKCFQSSSFTTKSTPFHKSIPDRLLKSPTDVGQAQTLDGRQRRTKKSNSVIEKKEKGSSAKEELITGKNSNVDDALNIDFVLKLDPHQEDLDTTIGQVDEEVLTIVNDNEMETKALVMEEDGHLNLPQLKVGSQAVNEVKIVESSMNGQDESIISPIENSEQIFEEGECSKCLSKLKKHIIIDNEKSAAAEAKAEDEENGEVRLHEEDIGGQEIDKKNEDNGGSTKDVQLQERENAKEESKEIKHDVENEGMNHQVIQGKKGSIVSNNVIEETATKLREQRQNKVKALAGAFETVILLQEPK